MRVFFASFCVLCFFFSKAMMSVLVLYDIMINIAGGVGSGREAGWQKYRTYRQQ